MNSGVKRFGKRPMNFSLIIEPSIRQRLAEYALGHVNSLLGSRLVVEITPSVVKR